MGLVRVEILKDIEVDVALIGIEPSEKSRALCSWLFEKAHGCACVTAIVPKITGAALMSALLAASTRPLIRMNPAEQRQAGRGAMICDSTTSATDVSHRERVS